MKKCTAGMFSKIVVILLFAAFFLPMAGLFLYLAVFDPTMRSASCLWWERFCSADWFYSPPIVRFISEPDGWSMMRKQ